ncbi:TRAP transporter substrate-binding protein [Botrimarina colliarenosi]|uniref:TRAP transporter substrate-binding protein n=1 Tax=Botrimarina colliarenosi TaxID=2528001 RepID=UPI001E396C99|nr:TRAP transporter substrate-binding protein [Botrimarina colliarenosi]
MTTCAYALIERSRHTSGKSDTVVLKLGHSLDTGHPVHLAMERMAERLEELSDGAVRMRIAPNGQLGSETECIELLQRGALAMTKTSTGPLESFIPEMAIFGVPYVFRSEEQFWNVLNGPIGDELLVSGDDSGMMGLCWYDAGARSFYTKSTPILQPDDLRGLKLRVQNSQTAMRMVEALGGSPTPLTFGELYTGLQQGLVDGAENNPPSFWTSRHFEVCKEYSLDEHTRVPDLLLISRSWWERLDPEQQAWLRQAAKESSEWEREAWRVRTEESLKAVEEAGVHLHYPDTKSFAERVAPMHDSYDGTAVGALMARVRETE